ncbi:hypothetical protein QLX08_006964 [Tetragonisca angustula]|uniref:Uncharacterized protein n=1 Tax=Tetragonisca angustula TaxID=166442 RepID=A0AAW0ZSC0_9HYME
MNLRQELFVRGRRRRRAETSANKCRKANARDERHRFLGSFSDLGVCNVTRATCLTAFASEAVPATWVPAATERPTMKRGDPSPWSIRCPRMYRDLISAMRRSSKST